MKLRHWQDIVSLLLGAWLTITPWSLGLSGVGAWLTVMLGLAVMLFAIKGLVLPSYLVEWGEIALGATLIALPWLLGYDGLIATANSVLVGMLVMVFAIWEMMTDGEFYAWWTDFSQRHSH